MGGCRICGGDLSVFLDLGRQPLSDVFRDPADDSPEFWYHLQVAVCAACRMVQLRDEVPRERMFHGDYPFRTSTSQRMIDHFTRTATRFHEQELTGADPFVVEIGCNDGTMLATLAARGVRHLGVDPATSAVADARRRGVNAVADYFERASAERIRKQHGAADLVYAANTICHIPYLDSILAGLDVLLREDGVFVFEDPYLGDVIDLGSFDQIYDEHFYLFSATTVADLAARFGFALVDVERLPVHGGEVRYTLARRGTRPTSPAVAALIAEEARRDLHADQTLANFAEEVARRRTQLVATLTALRAEGNTIAGYGATAKSATVLNYCGIGPELVPVIYDTTPGKQGLLAPGSHIPVRAFPADPADYPDCFLLLAWNHAEEIMAKETAFRAAGGRWVRYVPEVSVS